MSRLALDTFAITKNGFLPAELPLARLSDPYYEPWEFLIGHLSQLLKDRQLRQHVQTHLSTLSVERLKSEAEWRRAYVILAFLAHAHIWGGSEAADVLPPCISVPLLAVSAHLDLPPVATYAALNLWNFTSDSMSFDDPDHLKALHTFTGTVSESWFYVVSVAMECRAADIVPVLLRAIEAAQTESELTGKDDKKEEEEATVIDALRQFITCIHGIGDLLERMHEHCDPDVFFYQIRPFLAGSKNMAAEGLPQGVFYDEGEGRGSWRQLRGGSNGQSSLIQFFDVALGVEHTSSGAAAPDMREEGTGTRSSEPAFHEEVRAYMPGPHRRFLQTVRAMPGVWEFVNRHCGPDVAARDVSTELSSAYQDATRALAEFRNRHLSIVARYIILPSRRGRQQSLSSATTHVAASNSPIGLAKTTTALDAQHTPTGTGGTALLPFLKQTRDETLAAGRQAAPVR